MHKITITQKFACDCHDYYGLLGCFCHNIIDTTTALWTTTKNNITNTNRTLTTCSTTTTTDVLTFSVGSRRRRCKSGRGISDITADTVIMLIWTVCSCFSVFHFLLLLKVAVMTIIRGYIRHGYVVCKQSFNKVTRRSIVLSYTASAHHPAVVASSAHQQQHLSFNFFF